jgi:hypothetical protein
LHRFWIELDTPIRGLRTFGVTAIDLADALGLIRLFLEPATAVPHPARVIEDVDVGTFDQRHVLPNMLPTIWRGVWYPMSSLS